jgi:hypothetical protein
MPAHHTKDLESLSLPTPRANEPGSTSVGYGDSLNDFANRVVNGYARKDLELLRTPVASEAEGGAVAPEVAKANGQTLRLSGQMIDMVAPDQLPKLPTPTVSDQYTGNLSSKQHSEGSLHSVSLAQIVNRPDLLPTPNTMEHREIKTPEQIAALKAKSPGGYRNLRETVVNELFPTPITSDYKNGKSSSGYGANLPETAKTLMPTPTTRDYKDGSQPHQRDGKVQIDTVARAVFNSGEINLPTPTASDWKGANHSGSGSASSRGISTVTANLLKTPIAKEGLNGNTQTTSIKKGQLWLSNDVQDISLENGLREPDRNINLGDYSEIQWGKFEPAIRLWESIIGRPAPEPTKPDGRDNAHRLSSKFTEWMMGLPDGWITDIGLKRNDELKACGNGVVPQQAELALSLLGIKEILER